MFEHSVKVPRHFKIAANIFKKVSTEGGSVKTLLYDDKLRHFRTNVLFALITETIKHAATIDKIFEYCNLFKTESRLDPWLAKVLTTELLFGKKSLPGKSKPEQTILSYKEQFEQYQKENQDDSKTKDIRRPRYVRINTNLLTTSDAIGVFQNDGYRFIRCTSGSYDEYLKQIQSLTEYTFMQDYHIKTIFVFPYGTKLYEHELYLENKIILQDKATAMAVHLMAPPSGSVVLDMCAAPGMKTTQLAAHMRNTGKIYAVERSEQRYQTLCDFVEKTGCKCVQTFNKDSLDIERGDFEDTEYILLDPSCSGSGMDFCVHNYIEDTRLAKLTSLQEKFLKHAMNAFPNAKRIVYSTCSMFPEENERVITNVVKTSRAKWRVQDVREMLKDQWNNFGSGMYGSMGTRCLYAKPKSDLTTGFFLAVLDRDQKYFERAKTRKYKISENTINENSSNLTESKDNEEVEESDNEVVPNKKKKKDKHAEPLEDAVESEEVVPKRKRKHKEPGDGIQLMNNLTDDLQELNVENSSETESVPKKKKKNKDKHVSDDTLDDTKENNEITNKTHNEIDNNYAETNDLGHKHKKKKKVHNIEEECELAPIGIDDRAISKTSKKKRKHKDKMEIDQEEIEVPIKKRKKKDLVLE